MRPPIYTRWFGPHSSMYVPAFTFALEPYIHAINVLSVELEMLGSHSPPGSLDWCIPNKNMHSQYKEKGDMIPAGSPPAILTVYTIL